MSAAHLKGPTVDRPERKSGCTGKIAYASRADAKLAARKRNIRKEPYQCPHCACWHNTTRGKVKT